MENCTQVNIPQTDNSEILCEEYIKEACIIIENAIPFLGSGAGISLATLITKIVEKMKNQQRQINNLRTLLNEINNN